MSYATPKDALEAAVAIKGSQAAFARLVGVSQPTVWRWINDVGQMPADDGLVLRVEAETGVSRHELRPDVYPLPDRRTLRRGESDSSPPEEGSPPFPDQLDRTDGPAPGPDARAAIGSRHDLTAAEAVPGAGLERAR